jgi:RNA polymerase primary sigma factor
LRQVGEPSGYPWTDERAHLQNKPLIDLSDPATRRMVGLARRRGYVTREELEQVLPPDEFSEQQVENVIEELSKMGIGLVDRAPND